MKNIKESQYMAFLTLAKQLGGLKEIERFKGQYFWRDYPLAGRYESVADHSWRVAMLVLLVAPYLSRSINLEKALSFALLHDVPELITGDESPLGKNGTGKDSHAYNQTIAVERNKAEAMAFRQLVEGLESVNSSRLLKLWKSYQRSKSYEARLVRALDKLEALLQIQRYTKGYMSRKYLQFTLEYNFRYADVDPFVKELFMEVSHEFRENFREYVPSSEEVDHA